jgi:hypothetical protein
MKRVILAALLWISATGVAEATSYNGWITYFTRLHFSAEAWSKDVVGVYAHVGGKTTYGYSEPGHYYWSDVQHVRLERSGGAFVGKAVVHGPRSSGGENTHGLYVQYWVYFADGTELVTETTTMFPVSWEGHTEGTPEAAESYDRLERELEDDDTIDGTEVVAHEAGHVS